MEKAVVLVMSGLLGLALLGWLLTMWADLFVVMPLGDFAWLLR